MEALHPRIRVAWGLRVCVTAAVIGGGTFGLSVGLAAVPLWTVPAVVGGILLLGLPLVLLRYRIWRFELQDDAIFIVRGVITRVRAVVPYVRVQHVDTQRGPLDRILGLSSVVIYTAGSRGADVTIPGLSPDRADALQDRLRDLAVESESEDAKTNATVGTFADAGETAIVDEVWRQNAEAKIYGGKMENTAWLSRMLKRIRNAEGKFIPRTSHTYHD
jgi:membrane protein YdbS with pleckstrin-like domain